MWYDNEGMRAEKLAKFLESKGFSATKSNCFDNFVFNEYRSFSRYNGDVNRVFTLSEDEKAIIEEIVVNGDFPDDLHSSSSSNKVVYRAVHLLDENLSLKPAPKELLNKFSESKKNLLTNEYWEDQYTQVYEEYYLVGGYHIVVYRREYITYYTPEDPWGSDYQTTIYPPIVYSRG